MPDSLESFLLARLRAGIDTLLFGEKETEVLRLFYNKQLKVRQEKVPRFQIYARLCDGRREDDWPQIMIDADRAVDNLTKIGYVQDVAPSTLGTLTRSHVGNNAASTYELTAKGLEVLQSWYPPIALKLRAWIAVLPPWLVLVGSIAGGIGAIWKISELGFNLYRHLSGI